MSKHEDERPEEELKLVHAFKEATTEFVLYLIKRGEERKEEISQKARKERYFTEAIVPTIVDGMRAAQQGVPFPEEKFRELVRKGHKFAAIVAEEWEACEHAKRK